MTGRVHGTASERHGLYYYNARYYDPGIGRFVSPDTIVPEPLNPQAWNRYTYVLNNPLRYTDPTGLTHRDSEIAGLGSTMDALNAEAIGIINDCFECAMLSFEAANSIRAQLGQTRTESEWQHAMQAAFSHLELAPVAGPAPVTSLLSGTVILAPGQTAIIPHLGGTSDAIVSVTVSAGDDPARTARVSQMPRLMSLILSRPGVNPSSGWIWLEDERKADINLLIHEVEHLKHRWEIGNGRFNDSYIGDPGFRAAAEARAHATSRVTHWILRPR